MRSRNTDSLGIESDAAADRKYSRRENHSFPSALRIESSAEYAEEVAQLPLFKDGVF